MSELSDSALSRVKDSYRRLSAVASNLNSAADKLGASIAPLESAIKKLSLGVSSWVLFHEWHSENHVEYYFEEIGYIRISNVWGLAIRTRTGHEDSRANEESQTWPFNEAPRLMRVRSINKLPDLLEQLVKDATNIEADFVSQVETVEALGEALFDSAQEPAPSGKVSARTEDHTAELDFAASLTPDIFAISAAVTPTADAIAAAAPAPEVRAPAPAVPEPAEPPEVTETAAASARITPRADSAAAAAKVRQFLHLKDLTA